MNSTEECELCKKTFKNCYQLKRHKREVHGVKSTKENVKCIEEECNLVFSSICDLRAHLAMIHNQNSNTKEILCFVGKEEFHKWLANEERKTKTSFILTRGIKKFKNYSLYTYGCNRSGIYKSKGKGERQLKAQGSCKLGYHCTAQIILRVYSDHAEATYFSWHYRHDFLLGHVPIPAASKQNIAGKLAMGVEPSRILKDLKAISGDGIQKEHILRRKDISNIRNEFEIPAAGIGFTYGDDFQSVKAWVSTMQNKCVLLFKEQGSPHESIPSDDFMLVIMTESQKEMFKTFGWDRICIDSTYGVTGYGFELVTLMIVDEFEEGYPVAFCCCSTVNTSTMTVFLARIKAEVGEIAANVFMSDDTPIFYNAWMNVFGHAEMRLLCAWHVDRAWQGHLNCIIDVEKRKKIYAALKATLYELNKEKFYSNV